MPSRRLVLALPAALLTRPSLVHAQAAEPGTAARPLRVGVTAGVHAQVLERVAASLAAAAPALAIKVTEFSDFIQPNAALAGGDIDANTYQHQPFLDQQMKDRGYRFAAVGKTVMTAMAVFSAKAKSVADLPRGARVAIPNDPTNGGRALVLLAQAGLITLRNGGDFRSSVIDIVTNPRELRIMELDAAQIARALPDVDAGAITGNYAVAAGLDPLHDSLVVEQPEAALIRQYCCLVVVRQGDEARPWAKALATAYADPALRQWVVATFKGAVIPGASIEGG